MKSLLEKYGISVEIEKIEKLEKFGEILKFYGSKFNLTAVLDDEGIKIKHFLDSLLYVDKFSTNANIIEIGSGGGFPSIPNKILREDISFTLVEATGKKCEYLNTVVKELDLKNVTVINARAEELGIDRDFREKYDYSIARAVSRLNVLSELCVPFIKKGGLFVAFKGEADEELKEAESTFKTLGCSVKNIYEFDLPSSAGKRKIIEISKEKNTPSLYPRPYAKIKKNPL